MYQELKNPDHLIKIGIKTFRNHIPFIETGIENEYLVGILVTETLARVIIHLWYVLVSNMLK